MPILLMPESRLTAFPRGRPCRARMPGMAPDPSDPDPDPGPIHPARRIDPATGPRRRLSIKIGAWLLISTSGCAPEREPDPSPERVGRQNFACNDGSEVQVEFLANGLAIDLAVLPEGRSQRLTTPGRGLPFVGDGKNLYLSNGGIVIVPSDGPSLSCRPATIDPRQARRPP